MTDWPNLCLVIFTYEPEGEPRNTAARTLTAFLDLARYSGQMNVHIADDGSPDGHREALRKIAGGYEHVGTVGVTNTEQHGYGASYNRATQSVHKANEIIVPLEDDWELQRALDLDPLVATLLTPEYVLGGHKMDGRIECIRLGYLGFTQPLSGSLVHTEAGVMLMLDPDSTEPHVFAGHARIETRDFERRVGAWPVDTPAGRTEMTVAHRREAREGVAWPLDLTTAASSGASLFHHIGGHDLGEHQPEGATVEVQA